MYCTVHYSCVFGRLELLLPIRLFCKARISIAIFAEMLVPYLKNHEFKMSGLTEGSGIVLEHTTIHRLQISLSVSLAIMTSVVCRCSWRNPANENARTVNVYP